MRVLWLGDAGCHTGFARVTHSIGERLVSTFGHDVHVLATNYDGDFVDTPLKLYRPTTKLPTDVYGTSRFLEMLLKVQPDVVIVLNDAHIVLRFLFQNPWDEKRILLRHRPIVAYIPVDGTNVPATWSLIPKVVDPVVMCEFGRTAFPGAPVVYHGIDTSVYHPLSEGPIRASNGQLVRTKSEAKQIFGYDPDRFLVLRVDRNSMRKNYVDTWHALQPVMDKYSDIDVHFHCVPKDESDLILVASRNQSTKTRFFYPGDVNTFRGWPEENLAILYNAADAFVSTSWGEGFGLTLLEAAACGTPIVAQAASSIPEVVGEGGILIEPERRFTVYAGVDMALPNVTAFSQAIERLYLSKGLRRELGAKGASHAKSFSWDVAAERFDALIGDAATRPSKEVTDADLGGEVQDLLGTSEGVPE